MVVEHCRAFVTGQFEGDGLTDDLVGLSDQDQKSILEWQTEINLSVLPLSAGEETLPQIRRLLAASTPRRRVR